MRFFESEISQRRGDESFDEERFWPRLKCKVGTCFSDDRGTEWECDIIDVSESGFGIITDAKLLRGKTVTLTSPALKATVIWTRNNKAGLRINI